MRCSARAALLCIAVAAGLVASSAPLRRAAERLHLHPVSGRHERRRRCRTRATRHRPNVKCMHLAARRRLRHDGRRQAALHLRLLGRHRAAALRGRERERRRPGGLARELSGADHPPEGRAGVLPVAHQRRHDPAPRPVRPALGPLPRLPAGGVGLRRRARVLGDRSTWARPSPTTTTSSTAWPGPTCTTATSRRPSTSRWGWSATSTSTRGRTNAERPRSTRAPARLATGHRVRLQRRRRLARRYDVEYPIQIGSLRLATSTTSTSPSSRCPSRRWTTTTRLLNGRGYPDTVNPGVISTDAGFGNLPSQPLNSKIDGHAGPEGAAAPLEPRRHALLHARLDDPDARRRPEREAAARAGRGNEPRPTTTQLRHARRRRVGRRDPRHRRASAPGTYLLYTTNLNYLSNDARGLRRHDDRDHGQLARGAKHMSRIGSAHASSGRACSRSLGVCAASPASAEIPGVTGTSFTLTAKADRITTPDGNSIYFWGFAAGQRTARSIRGRR